MSNSENNMSQGSIPEDSILFFQALNLSVNIFENNIKIRTDKPELITMRIINNDELIFYNEKKEPILTSYWEFLATYSKLDNQPISSEELKTGIEETKENIDLDQNVVDIANTPLPYIWTWSWALLPEKRNLDIKKYLTNISSREFLSRNVVQFNDPMVISYLLSFMAYQMKLEYIYTHTVNNTYSAIGLKNIKWLIEPDPKLEELHQKAKIESLKTALGDISEDDMPEINNTVLEELKKSLQKEVEIDLKEQGLEVEYISKTNDEKKGKTVNWQRIFELYGIPKFQKDPPKDKPSEDKPLEDNSALDELNKLTVAYQEMQNEEPTQLENTEEMPTLENTEEMPTLENTEEMPTLENA